MNAPVMAIEGAKRYSRPRRRAIRVMIVEDHKLFADVIALNLERRGIEITIVTRGDEAANAARQIQPDLVLMDLRLPGMSGFVAAGKIRELVPRAKIVALTALTDDRRVREAERAGFDRDITKDTPLRQFTRSINEILVGLMEEEEQSADAGGRGSKTPRGALPDGHLTPRERQVLSLLAEGTYTEEIAKQLSITPATVRTHIRSILSKLQVRSRLEAVAFAVQHQIIRAESDRFDLEAALESPSFAV